MICTDGEDAAEDGRGLFPIKCGAVPALRLELVLTLGDSHFGTQADCLPFNKSFITNGLSSYNEFFQIFIEVFIELNQV